MIAPGTPVLVLREGSERSTGKSAQQNNLQAAIELAQVLRPTLGPRGLDKMLVDRMGEATVTNDGATILEKMEVDHPAAKMVVEVALAQDRVAGDGTKSAVILAGALLKQAEELLESGVHPASITGGFAAARDRAVAALPSIARPVGIADRGVLEAAARTSMSSKLASHLGITLAPLFVAAACEVAQERDGRLSVDMADIALVKVPGHAADDASLLEGVVIDKEPAHPEMEERVLNPAIAIIGGSIAVRKTEVAAAIKIVEPGQAEAFLEQEERGLRGAVAALRSVGATVVACGKEVDPSAGEMLARAGVVAIERVSDQDLKRLAKASGATVVARAEDLEPGSLGHAELLEWRREGGKRHAFIAGCRGAKAVTLVLRGGTAHVVDEIERSAKDALCVVKGLLEEGLVLPGGGASVVELARVLREAAHAEEGREQLAVEAFADALEELPRALAKNAGHDPLDALLALRLAHARGQAGAGVDPRLDSPQDMWAEGVVEPLRVVRQEIQSATEAAVMLLRIDDVIAARRKAGDRGHAPRGAGHLPPPLE